MQAGSRLPTVPPVALLAFRGLRTTPCALKNIRAGVPKATINRDKPLTYEQSQAPYKIGVTKGWNSWHSGDFMFDAHQPIEVVTYMVIYYVSCPGEIR